MQTDQFGEVVCRLLVKVTGTEAQTLRLRLQRILHMRLRGSGPVRAGLQDPTSGHREELDIQRSHDDFRVLRQAAESRRQIARLRVRSTDQGKTEQETGGPGAHTTRRMIVTVQETSSLKQSAQRVAA